MIRWVSVFTTTWYSSGTFSKQVLLCVQFREMEVLREVTLVMTGGLGVAANGQEKMYYYIENAFKYHMYIGDEVRAIYMYNFIQSHACIVGTPQSPCKYTVQH